MRQFPMIF